MAASMLPLVASNALLQSIMPAPVLSRRFLIVSLEIAMEFSRFLQF
jgi:hypothetical protein